jgi:hypothetical protein
MLVAYAALGVCDSVPDQVARVESAIDTYVEPNGRITAWNQLLPRALSMAAPCDGGRALLRVSSDDRLIQMQRALARGDHSAIRHHFALLDETRRSDRPGDVAIDYTFQEAWILSAIGDSTSAAMRLDRALNALPTLGDSIVERVDQAAALGRALRLRQAMANRSQAAEMARNHLAALWREADDDVRGRQPR